MMNREQLIDFQEFLDELGIEVLKMKKEDIADLYLRNPNWKEEIAEAK